MQFLNTVCKQYSASYQRFVLELASSVGIAGAITMSTIYEIPVECVPIRWAHCHVLVPCWNCCTTKLDFMRYFMLDPQTAHEDYGLKRMMPVPSGEVLCLLLVMVSSSIIPYSTLSWTIIDLW
mmetsp:Transcript_14676/g.40546  ORF Transcript_14676/g.40546 Transcript_14676/m.40546 type:complete len:123 (-) Transcript_14676:71-439(-)